MNPILKKIFQLGENMQQALAADDLDGFYNLVDQRDVLVNKLIQAPKNKDTSQIDTSESQALEAQYSVIIEALNKKENAMMQQLRQIDQFKRAGKSYGNSKTRPQFINPNLRG